MTYRYTIYASLTMRRPKKLFREWKHIRARVVRARRLFLFLDFDGTLAPIRPRPEQVRLSRAHRVLLERIRRGGAVLAIISGRALPDIRRRAGLSGIWYSGAHGFFLLSPRNRRISLLTSSQRTHLERALRPLRRRLRGLRGIQLEPKQATIAVHYRRAAAHRRKLAFHIVRELIRNDPRLKLLSGKKVWEILPAARIDKWTAVRTILAYEKWRASKDLLFYVGDDTTDEAVFRKMKGIPVAVGKQRGTAARYFLRSHREVRKLLERWDEISLSASNKNHTS